MKHLNVALFVPHMGCPHRCVFCDQNAISGAAPVTPEQITAACDIALKNVRPGDGSEIAFFGGSFTAIDRNVQRMCLEPAAPYLKRGFSGIRVSTRPDAINEDILSFLLSFGVTAVELGAQSMDDSVLQKNGRGHTAADTVRAAGLIKQAGISLGLQMMTGLYGSTPQTDLATAEALAALEPSTVRIYPTVVLRGTALERLYERGVYVPPTLQSSVQSCAAMLRLFHGRGIPVIRLGLHAGGDVPGSYVAGPYHPAFRELCEAHIYKEETERLLAGAPPGAYTLLVGDGEISKAVGQKRSNLLYFEKNGYRLKVRAQAGVAPYAPVLYREPIERKPACT